MNPENRNGEPLGETLERLVGDDSLVDFADDAAEATDGARATPPSVEG